MPSFLSLCPQALGDKGEVDTQSMRSRPEAKIKVATLILIHTGASDHFCRKSPWTGMLAAPLKAWLWLIHVCPLASVPP